MAQMALALQPITGSDVQPDEEMLSLGRLVERKPGDKTHFCLCCSFPIAVFGRLYPCLHAFCLACSSDMPACFMCQAPITRVERYARENRIFISPATMQSFKTEEELINHTRKVHQHLLSTAQTNDKRKAEAAAKAKAVAEAKIKADAEVKAKAEAAAAELLLQKQLPPVGLPPPQQHPGGMRPPQPPAQTPQQQHQQQQQQQQQQQMAAQQQQQMVAQQQQQQQQQLMMQQQMAQQQHMAAQRAAGLGMSGPGQGGGLPGSMPPTVPGMPGMMGGPGNPTQLMMQQEMAQLQQMQRQLASMGMPFPPGGF